MDNKPDQNQISLPHTHSTEQLDAKEHPINCRCKYCRRSIREWLPYVL